MSESVSVIITCYNLNSYIKEAIDSALSQDYPGEVQVVVVDDLSTDGSRELLLNTEGIDLVLQNENSGVMNAIIAGLSVTRHDVIFFLDGDDCWHPKKLSECMRSFSEDTKFCTHDLWYADSAMNRLPRQSRVSEVLSPVPSGARSELIERCILDHLDYVWLGSAFGVRRSLSRIDQFIAFCKKRDYLKTCYQDWPLAVWVILQNGGKLNYVDKKLFSYRLHENNYSGSSQTLEKLRRNQRKAYDTIRIIVEIMDEMLVSRAQQAPVLHLKKLYELGLASTSNSRKDAFNSLFNNLSAFGFEPRRLKFFLRALLTGFLGAKSSHCIIEKLKS